MQKICFNDGWTFANELRAGEAVPVTLPHDAMQTEQRIRGLKNGEATGYYPGGRYVYEKEFLADEEMERGTCFLEFEGIYQKAQVYLNEELLGTQIYGYTDFLLELTGKLKRGNNRLRVVADNTQTPNSRWYSGSGIYRDVYLHLSGDAYIKPYGVKITTKSIKPAVLTVEIDAKMGEGMELWSEVFYQGERVGQMAGERGEIVVENARLWSAKTPEMYQVRVSLKQGREVLDVTEERIGIRRLSWSHEKGFQVNGKTVKLRGGCVHHDHGPLGACSFYNAEKRRLKKMKAAGFNAVRYAHNPAAKPFLDACDEIGMYVMDETFDMWESRKSDRDYGQYFASEWEKDVSAMIRVARNHPSVVMYSIGNEILDIGLPTGAEWNRRLTDLCHQLDASRPVINALSPGLTCMAAKGIGVNRTKVSPNDSVDPYEVSQDSKASGSKLVNILITIGPLITKLIGSPKKMEKLAKPVIEQLDICGYNYGIGNYETHLKHHPNSVLCGSETFSSQIAKHWDFVMKHDCMIGEFVWTAWDYLGEAGIGLPRYEGMSRDFSYSYPCISAGSGCFDLTGHMDGQGAHVMSVWGQQKTPYIGVRPLDHVGEDVSFGRWRNTDAIDSWSWKGCEGKTARIEIFASAAETELFLNGESLGRKTLTDGKAAYETVYRPGVLEAKCYDAKGNLTGSSIQKTAGEETVLTVEAEETSLTAKNRDVAYIDIAVTDEEGTVKTLENRKVTVEVEGAGYLAAVGSANPLTEELYTGKSFTTYQGRMIAVVRAAGEAGEIRVTVSAEGLEKKSLTLQAV